MHRIHFAAMILLLTAAISVMLIFRAMTGLDTSRPSSPFPYPARAYPPPQEQSRIPPLTPIGQPVDTPRRLLILSRELNIPLDHLKAMSAEQIQRLYEENAERLRVNVYRLTRQPDGTETWLEFRGIKSPTPTLIPQSKSSGTSHAAAAPCAHIQNGLAFLRRHYVPAVGLIRESPIVAPNRFWLTSDNALVAFTFSQLGESEKAASLTSSLQRYGYSTNGLIEVVWSVPIAWPPHAERQVLVAQIGVYQVWQEFHDSGPTFEDWRDYSNLGFLGALNEYRLGRPDSALRIFQQTITQFDGTGFNDKARNSPDGHKHYETYKLALALYVGSVIGAPLGDLELQLLSTLRAMQSTDGGFTTLYWDLQTPEGDANTETTALALLALHGYGCAP